MNGVDMAFERAAHSERHDRAAMFGADLDDCRDFFGRHRKDDDVRKSRRVPRLAMAVVFADGFRRGDAIAENARSASITIRIIRSTVPRTSSRVGFQFKFHCSTLELWNTWNVEPNPGTMEPSEPWNMFTSKTLSFLRSLKRNNKREWFHERRDQYETHCRQPMIGDRRAARGRLSIVCAGDARRSEGVPAATVSGHPIQRRQDAVEVAPRGDVSESRAWPHERRRVLFRGGARVGVDRRRLVAAGYVAAATGARAHRRQPARVRQDREGAALQEDWRTARATR